MENEQFHPAMRDIVEEAYQKARALMEELRPTRGYVTRRQQVNNTYAALRSLALSFGLDAPPFRRSEGPAESAEPPARPPRAEAKPKPVDDPGRQVLADNADEPAPKEEIKTHQRKTRKRK